MPNWVKNIITARAETINKIKEKYFEDGVLSFQKVIPMPEDLNIESSGRGELGLMYLYIENNKINKDTINKVYRSLNCFHTDIYKEKRFQDAIKEYEEKKDSEEIISRIELAKKYISNYEKYGEAEWYEWCVSNWGTKWDASRVFNNETMIIFETAWSCPAKVLIEISRGLNGDEFELKYADEDFGSDNNGIVHFKNGDILDFEVDMGEDFVAEVWCTNIENNIEKTPDIVDEMFE